MPPPSIFERFYGSLTDVQVLEMVEEYITDVLLGTIDGTWTTSIITQFVDALQINLLVEWTKASGPDTQKYYVTIDAPNVVIAMKNWLGGEGSAIDANDNMIVQGTQVEGASPPRVTIYYEWVVVP